MLLRKSILSALVAAGLFALPHLAAAQSAVMRIPLPNNSPFPISEGVWVGDTLYLSGSIDSSITKGTPGDTQAQTVNVLQSIQKTLAEQHLTLGDVVLMHAYLAGDPSKGGKMDFCRIYGRIHTVLWYKGSTQQAGAQRHAGGCTRSPRRVD